jgi:ABC-type transport system involved in cytochrome c biogenesis permease subunit
MSDESMNSKLVNKAADDELDLRILRALETAPNVEIPADFAARVANRLPVRRRPVSLTATHYGRNAVFLGMILSLVVLIALSLSSGRHATFGLAESLLLTQFIVLTVWLSVRRYSV